MCGIVGIARTAETVDYEIILRMRNTLKHRGPDDQGAWISSDRRVGFGHQRLSIIDLSPKGHQPMLSQDRTICITFNGEIYNFLELRDKLQKRGHNFESDSDTEVLLGAYAEWGTEALQRLNGMFAFALYDANHQRVVVARDRAGEKPFFYWHAAGSFHFASELKALMVDPSLSRRIDLGALNHYFAFGYVPGARCMLEGVRKLPPGHSLIYDLTNDTISTWQYWNLPPPPTDGGAWSQAYEEELIDQLEGLLRDSVRRQMIADVPVGILLSGGVDSSLITAMAASLSDRPIKTFTVTFPGHGVYDESAHARLVARHFGTRHSELVAEPTALDLLPRLANQYDEPMADSSMLPTYLISKLIRQEATVALGGDGADELFGGYPHHTWVQRQERIRPYVPRVLRAAIGRAASEFMPLGMRGRNWIIGFRSDLRTSIAHINMFFDAKARRELLAPIWVRLVQNGLSPEIEKGSLARESYTALQQSTRVDFMTYLAEDILVKVDRASMLTSLEIRAPWLDYRIIEFAFGRVPDTLRATEKGRKVLLRRLAARVLPPEFNATRKQGFSIPFASWFNGPWGAYIEDVLKGADSRIFDSLAVRRLIKGQRHGYSNAHRLFALTMFELWRRAYNVSVD